MIIIVSSNPPPGSSGPMADFTFMQCVEIDDSGTVIDTAIDYDKVKVHPLPVVYRRTPVLKGHIVDNSEIITSIITRN